MERRKNSAPHSLYLVRIALIPALMLSSALQAWAVEHPPLREALLPVQRWLLVNNMDWKRTGAQNAIWFDAFLREIPDAKFNLSDKDWWQALTYSILLGKHDHLFYQNSGYVREEPVVKLLIAALKDKHKDRRELVFHTLAFECHQEDLERYAKEILTEVKPDALVGDEWNLYAKLPLEQAQRDALAKNEKAPIEVRARAGDAGSVQKLIDDFAKANDYHEMQRLGKRLGYAGTPRCAEALVKGLQSPVEVDVQTEARSIRGDVLLALGRIYQKERLFTTDAQFLTQNSDEMFETYRGHAEYTKEVDEWVQKNFKHPAWGGGEVWFVKVRNTPILPPGYRPPQN